MMNWKSKTLSGCVFMWEYMRERECVRETVCVKVYLEERDRECVCMRECVWDRVCVRET